MPQSYDYDEGGETWPFFVLTMLMVILVPLTIKQVWGIVSGPSKEELEQKKLDEHSTLNKLGELHTSDDIKRFRADNKKTKSKIFSKTTLFVILGWVIVSVLIQIINSNESIAKSAMGTFDPYEILGVSVTSSDRDIKSAFRKLSLKFHPDKMSKDLSEKEKEEVSNYYVQISKAYEALTDEVTKQNYIMYGHPDGPQSQLHGIALPSFLVSGPTTALVLLSYVFLLSLVLPYFVGNWWSKAQSYTKKGLHVNTASYFADRLINYKPSEIVTVDLIIKWLSHAEEFKLLFPKLSVEKFEQLLKAHINREKIDQSEKHIQYRVVSKCHTLIGGLVDIACGFRYQEIASISIDTFKAIVQAVPNTPYSEIFQLPYVDEKHFLDSNEEVYTLGKLFTYDDEKIGKILGIKDKEQLKETLAVASNIPFLRIVRAEFVVPGEKEVTPNSVPHISLKLLVRSANQKTIPMDKFSDELINSLDSDVNQSDIFANVAEQPIVPYSYAPKFPAKRRNAWYCLISLQKDNKIVQTPVTIDRLSFRNLDKDFDKRIIKTLTEENFKPEEWEIGVFKIPLGQPAPEEKADIYFRVAIKSTDYYGSDLDFTMTMQVREPSAPSKIEQLEAEDYEEDDEESDDDSEEDSDEDEEDSASDYTDIDTDTESEAEADQ